MEEPPRVFGEAMDALLKGETLSERTAYGLFSSMLDGSLGDARVAALLALLRTHEETPGELTGAARAMREHVTPVAFDRGENSLLLDTCGTGGAPKTFNVSTCAAIVLAGVTPPPSSGFQRLYVAKHGNKSRTGRGSAEVLTALGVNVDVGTGVQAACLESCGVCFCYAVHHHPSIKHAMPARRALGVPTIFNALGPLTNPAGADAQLIGVYKDALVEPVAQTLAALGADRGMVVHSEDGLDELTLTAPSRCVRVVDGALEETRVDPRDLGMELVSMDEVSASDATHSAGIIRSVVSGEASAFLDMTLLTCAGALWGARVAATMQEGLGLARESVGSGAAQRALEALVERTNA